MLVTRLAAAAGHLQVQLCACPALYATISPVDPSNLYENHLLPLSLAFLQLAAVGDFGVDNANEVKVRHWRQLS
jgi:hypothetical protein